MLSKLLSLLVAGKGGAVAAAVVVAGATTVGVMTSSTDLQDSLQSVVASVSGVVSPGMSEIKDKDDLDCEHGKPVVVAQRNLADKQLRTAAHEQQKRLEQLRGGKDVDHQQANALIQKADRDLRGVLTKALNDVAALTLGREGQNKESATPTATASPTASLSASATPTPTPTPTATPTATASPTASLSASATPKPTCTPAPSATPSASPTVLTAQLQSIVDKAISDMKAIVDKAAADVAALPTPSPRGKGDEHKPSTSPGTSGERGKPEATNEHGKSDEHRPSPSPTPRP